MTAFGRWRHATDQNDKVISTRQMAQRYCRRMKKSITFDRWRYATVKMHCKRRKKNYTFSASTGQVAERVRRLLHNVECLGSSPSAGKVTIVGHRVIRFLRTADEGQKARNTCPVLDSLPRKFSQGTSVTNCTRLDANGNNCRKASIRTEINTLTLSESIIEVILRTIQTRMPRLP